MPWRWKGEAGGRVLERESSKLLRVTNIFTLLNIVIVSWLYAYVKVYQIKYVHFTACQLHINKTEGVFLKGM